MERDLEPFAADDRMSAAADDGLGISQRRIERCLNGHEQSLADLAVCQGSSRLGGTILASQQDQRRV